MKKYHYAIVFTSEASELLHEVRSYILLEKGDVVNFMESGQILYIITQNMKNTFKNALKVIRKENKR